MNTGKEAEAIAESAKAAAEGIKASRDFGGFVGRIIGGTLEQGIGLFEDKLTYMRWERQVRLMKRSQEFLKEVGLEQPTRRIPLNIAIPLLEAASLEEDDELQDMWARLLVNAADADSGVEVKRSFISILQGFGQLEAKLLDLTVRMAPDETDSTVQLLKLLSNIPGYEENPTNVPNDVDVAIWNLIRLGCAVSMNAWPGPDIAGVAPTALGKNLVKACTLKDKALGI